MILLFFLWYHTIINISYKKFLQILFLCGLVYIWACLKTFCFYLTWTMTLVSFCLFLSFKIWKIHVSITESCFCPQLLPYLCEHSDKPCKVTFYMNLTRHLIDNEYSSHSAYSFLSLSLCLLMTTHNHDETEHREKAGEVILVKWINHLLTLFFIIIACQGQDHV